MLNKPVNVRWMVALLSGAMVGPALATTITFNGTETITYNDSDGVNPSVTVTPGSIEIIIPGVALTLNCTGVDLQNPTACTFDALQETPPAPPANNPPVAVIGTPSCTELSCSFSGSGSTDADQDPLTYSWNFGDGTSASVANPTKVYENEGTYSVMLTVSDGMSSGQAQTQVQVTAPVPPGSGTGSSDGVSSADYCQNPASSTVECSASNNLDSIYETLGDTRYTIPASTILSLPFTVDGSSNESPKAFVFTEVSGLPIGFTWRFWLSEDPAGAVYNNNDKCAYLGAPRKVIYATQNPTWDPYLCALGYEDKVLHANFAVVRTDNINSLYNRSFIFELSKQFSRF